VQCELDHDNEVTCIDLDCDALRVASGTVDGMLLYNNHVHVSLSNAPVSLQKQGIYIYNASYMDLGYL
jgi:hypothetical protein